MNYIGIGHKKRHGKTTVARMIRDCLDEEFRFSTFKRYAFADRLKEVVDLLFPSLAPFKEDKERVHPKLGFSYRDACEKIGEMFRQSYGSDFWVRALERQIEAEDKDWVIVSDVRHPDEANWIKSKGGVLIKVVNPRLTSSSTHISEIALDGYTGWDITIVNHSSLESLERKVHTVVREIIQEKME